ncbi:hypothetical protein BSZ35_00665 [Salinibacter sp. 10B]|nr:hypothetical protein BSZ35_00665 [Salinibacter sp. 10B]
MEATVWYRVVLFIFTCNHASFWQVFRFFLSHFFRGVDRVDGDLSVFVLSDGDLSLVAVFP